MYLQIDFAERTRILYYFVSQKSISYEYKIALRCQLKIRALLIIYSPLLYFLLTSCYNNDIILIVVTLHQYNCKCESL